MFLLAEPSEFQISTHIACQKDKKPSYSEVGGTRGELPSGYTVLRGRVELGRGAAVFERAIHALRRWKMFEVPGIRLCWPDTSIRIDETVAVIIHHFGFWSLNTCKIVYVLDEDGPVRRFGFAYGTLRDHAERGEERFSVNWRHTSGIVSYDILSFSRPSCIAIRLGYPLARRLQERFVQQSLAAMKRAVDAA